MDNDCCCRAGLAQEVAYSQPCNSLLRERNTSDLCRHLHWMLIHTERHNTRRHIFFLKKKRTKRKGKELPLEGASGRCGVRGIPGFLIGFIELYVCVTDIFEETAHF